jgi:hypothetical protein
MPGANGKGIPFADMIGVTKSLNGKLFGANPAGIEAFRLPANAKIPPAAKKETTGFKTVTAYSFTLKDLGGTRNDKVIALRVANNTGSVDGMYLFDTKGKKLAYGQVGSLAGQPGFGWSIMMGR